MISKGQLHLIVVSLADALPNPDILHQISKYLQKHLHLKNCYQNGESKEMKPNQASHAT